MTTPRQEANSADACGRLGAWARVFGLFALLALLAWRNPVEQRWIPPCPVSGTGFLCPGCGSLRAIHYLTRLHLQEALQANILMVVVGVPAILCFVREQARTIAGRRVASSVSPYLAWIILGIILAFTVARNLPGGAFDGLRPAPLSSRRAGPVSSVSSDQEH